MHYPHNPLTRSAATRPLTPAYESWLESVIQDNLSEATAHRGGGGCEVRFISVVFHVIGDPQDPGFNVTNQQIFDQLDRLNSEYDDPNPNSNGERACIRFCLAQTTYNDEPWTSMGSNVPGITRWNNSDISNYTNDDAPALAQLVQFPPDQYMNVYIVNTFNGPNGPGGFANFPGNQWFIDGVFIIDDVLTDLPLVQGILLVHEVGHWLGLFHTFHNGCNAPGDWCDDTPPQNEANDDTVMPGCNDNTPMSCNVLEDLDNYMDNLPEACQTTFTACQVGRMDAVLLGLRANLVDPLTHVLTGISGGNPACAPLGLTAAFYNNGMMFCLDGVGEYSGIVSADFWEFVVSGPGGTTSVTGSASIPEHEVVFDQVGQWEIMLELTIDGVTVVEALIVYVSECPELDQGNCHQWYFGAFCALDFGSGAPVAIDGSMMISEGGPSVTCDPLNGAMQFYASNFQAHNVNNVGLGVYDPLNPGSTFSSQGALFVPFPGNPDWSYLFHTSDNSQTVGPLHYSIVDVNTADYQVANVSVGVTEPNTTQHLAGVPHCNGTDYWVVTHGLDSGNDDQFLSYLVTNLGISNTAVTSGSFSVVNPAARMGYLEFSRSGELAAVVYANTCGIYSFDRENGTFEWIVDLPPGTAQGPGSAVSFSRSGDFLYTMRIGQNGGIFQHDFRNLNLCDPQVENNFTPFPNGSNVLWAQFQLGPDDKVYMSNYVTEFVSVINYPEIWNENNNNEFGFSWQAVNVVFPGGVAETCTYGLPNLIDAQPDPVDIDFEWCSNDCGTVIFEMRGCGADPEWDVVGEGGAVDGLGVTFTYTFSEPGTYAIVLSVTGHLPVTHTIDLLIPATPIVEPQTVCAGVPTAFSASNTVGLDHQWTVTGDGTPTTSTDTEFEVTWNGAGTLTLEVTDPLTGCMNSESIVIEPLFYQPDAGPDATVCVGEAIALGGNLGTALDCEWSPTTNLNMNSLCSPVFTATTAGTYAYTVQAADANGCVGVDEVVITVVDTQCDDLTIAKWVTPNSGGTYAGAPVLYTIQVCNTSGGMLDDVEVNDVLPDNFTVVMSPTFPEMIALEDGECVTFEIFGSFTQIGTYTNMATLAHQPTSTNISASVDMDVLEGCPMLVYGSGGCDLGSEVSLCLGVHTDLQNLTAINYYIAYPDFLQPPLPGPLTLGNEITLPLPFQPAFASASIEEPAPLGWSPTPLYDYQVVEVTVTFDPPGVDVSPPYWIFCIGFEVDLLGDGVPDGLNTAWTWASTNPPPGFNNQVTATVNGDPVNLWTQAHHIVFTGCPNIEPPNAEFNVDVPGCGGAVTVNAALNDPEALHIWTWGDDRTTPINGAPSWTYDYFEPITDNQGWGVNIPPADPGTYTITHTVVLDGETNSSTQEVTIYACCEANLMIPHNTLSSTLGMSAISGTVDIQGLLIVDDYLLFQSATIYMEPGAEIVVQPGVVLDLDASSITSCQDVMWKSITVADGASVYMRNSFIDDAENALVGLDGSTLWMRGNQFHNNRVAVQVPAVDGVPWNDVVVYADQNTFYSAGPMKAPHAQQTTAIGQQGFAAFEVHNMALDLSNGWNLLHNLSNGIVAWQSDVRVEQCTFMHIQPDPAYASVGNGSGIYANGSGSWSALRQQGFGKNGTPSFWNCRWGVYTEYMNIESTDNHMVEMGTAYRVDRSGYREVDILNNQVSTRFNGIDLRANDGAAHILVQGNDITFGNDLSCTACKGWTAIRVTEGNYVAPDSRIQNNTIHFLPQYASRFGIGLFAADRWVVAENELSLVNNAFNRTGIWLNGCRATEVSCNTVTSADNTYPVDAQAAIRNNMGSTPLISCNEMDQTANGILFNGVAYNTDVRGNQFHNHRWPLHLDATAIIDAQTLKGNLWDPNATAPVWGAWYEVSNLQAMNYQFLYNPATIGSGTTVPPSWSPPNWFAYDPGPNYDCADHHGVHYCSQFGGERCKDCIRELDEKIASDSLENDPYTDETKWMLKGDLYKKLDDSPALLDSLPELDAFYAMLQGSTTAAFKAIADDQLALYDLDSTVVAQLQANRTQIEVLMALVKAGMEQLGDSTLTPEQRQTILGDIGGYRQNINSLASWNTTALEVAAASKVLTADGVKAANSGIATSELIEANEKGVNEVYLATIGKDVDEFSSTQADDLFAIANQCPMLGGNAVFKARSLYWLIDDSYDFDDQLLCLPHGIIVKSLMTKPVNSITVVPNPASDEATLVLDQALDETGVFIVFDAVGAMVMRQVVPMDMPRIAFSTASLAPALYHYQVRGPSGIIGVGKLTIVR